MMIKHKAKGKVKKSFKDKQVTYKSFKKNQYISSLIVIRAAIHVGNYFNCKFKLLNKI